MAWFQNPPNPLLEEREFALSPDYSPLQWVLLALLWIVLLPVCLPLWLLGRLLVGAVVLSGTIAFSVAERVFHGPVDKAQPFQWQCVRAWLNNCVGTRLPHWNGPFRRFIFRLSGVRIGRGSFIGMGGYMEDYLPQNVIIEDNVTVSFGVTFIAHGAKQGRTEQEKYIILRKGAYVGAASVLIPGIEIGPSAVVGSGSVVTKDVPPGAIVAGAPARILGYKTGYQPASSAEEED
ncbi:MAG: DapH/DapD/GlmU-related protein [Armatimonadia bacterium]